MPIYAYRCSACGHAKDVLQKMSDAPLSTCPSCGAETFSKQVTAAGFQLKGSGWYVTDFRSGSGGAGAASTGAASGTAAVASGGAEAGGQTAPAADSGSATAATPSASGGDSAAGGGGTSRACH